MRDRMPPEMLARARGQGQATNKRNQTADVANGFGVTRADKQRARRELIAEVGPRKAKQLMRDSADRAVKGWR
ncbi:hypothetical protein [Nonomuraea sp. SBT364]|uniref:hypothetical protein n=1 Tax=Nonomuraea sp. SBT364 TaxID=1580530 RepID=UPI00066C6B16|nr:hypothetical protein [Nonomuraea sp. SBT364]